MTLKHDSDKAITPELLRDRCDALYIWHKDPLYRIALKALNGDSELALEVVERTFVVAFHHIDKIDEEQSDKTKAFMVATMKGVLNLIYQKARERVGIPSEFGKIYITEQDRYNVDQVLTRNEMLSKLATYVDALSYREKEILFYRFFIGWPPKKIGEQFQLSEEEAESCIFQIKQKIAKMMLMERRP